MNIIYCVPDEGDSRKHVYILFIVHEHKLLRGGEKRPNLQLVPL